ncbi:MAG TPA: transposase [Blastocatellia bacterium]|nr:transposase [Blastocatellia bacterium]
MSWRVRRPVHCIADVLRDLKKESSTWAKENFNRRFAWQEGYAAFAVSPTTTASVRRYIATQEAHHRKHSFVDELRELLNAARIEFDEKRLNKGVRPAILRFYIESLTAKQLRPWEGRSVV